MSGVAETWAGHISIKIIPNIITHCSPGLIEADLHTTLSRSGPTSQS